VTRYFGRLDDLLSAPGAHVDLAGLYMLAVSRAFRGYGGQAIGPIEQMIQQDYGDREALEKAEEFQALQSDPQFKAAVAKIGAKRTPGAGR
jgi:hypothetical protein